MIQINFAYLRKSPDDAESTESSITNQLKEIQYLCEKNSWILKDENVYIDKSRSGSDRGRPQFNRMIDLVKRIKKEHPDYELVIIVKDQDRFCRDSSFFSDTLQDLEARQIKVYSIIANKYLSYEDLGDQVKSMVDSNYIVIQRKKAQINMQQKMRDGMPTFKPVFGYKYKDKLWFIDSRKADIVKGVCLDYCNGIQFRDIIKKYRISKDIYYTILKNASNGLYNGFIYYVRKYRDSNKIIVRTEEIKYKSSHQPIISEELFNKVQDKINRKT